MKSSLTLLALVLLLVSILAGCAAGPNQFRGTATEHNVVAGFWLGLWQGFIAPLVFVVSLFKSNLNIYKLHNNGAWDNFGYLFGLACFFGGGGHGSARRQRAISSSGLGTGCLYKHPPTLEKKFSIGGNTPRIAPK